MASGFSSRIVVDFKPFTKPASMRVCPSVGPSVFVCAPAAEPSWHSAETSWQKTERLLLNLHQRCPFIFLLKHLNKRRLFLKRWESYWCKDCSAFYSSALTEFCSFIFTNVFFVVFYYAGLALGHARHPQYSGARWMYCCKYIVTLSNAVTVDSLHMYY